MGIDQLRKDFKRAVFLDRDGVLNRSVVRGGKPFPPASVEELEILPGVPEALRKLKESGFLLIGATNQPDVARGTQSREVVEKINMALLNALPLDEILVCYHDDSDNCRCRKPRPGLLIEAAQKYSVRLEASFMVGDRWRDIEAGRNAGCRTVLIDYGYMEKHPGNPPDLTAFSLMGAVDWILCEHYESGEEKVKGLSELKVKVFAVGADKGGMLEMYKKPYIKGFTTNPTLMRKAGITDYESFARDILEAIPDRPISLEVFSDEFDEMEQQARKIASWGRNVYVKIPVMNTRGDFSSGLVRDLSKAGVKVNVTAMMTLKQVRDMVGVLAGGPPAYVSVFAGRVADSARDPVPLMKEAVDLCASAPNVELIWASPRELLNIFQADEIGCHVITVTNDILKKLDLVGKDLEEFSLDTVKMFRNDALASGYRL
jgi:transaldolase